MEVEGNQEKGTPMGNPLLGQRDSPYSTGSAAIAVCWDTQQIGAQVWGNALQGTGVGS